MKLAILVSALGSAILSASAQAEDLPQLSTQSLLIAGETDLSSTRSTRPQFFTAASTLAQAETGSSSDFATGQPGSTPSRPEVVPNPLPQSAAPGIVPWTHPATMMMSPSHAPTILQLMRCDPHSCPNLWDGYDLQRANELARKCNPPSLCHHGCGCGHGCKAGSACGSSPCVVGPVKQLNRYRQQAPTLGCTTCQEVAVSPPTSCEAGPACDSVPAPEATEAAESSPAAVEAETSTKNTPTPISDYLSKIPDIPSIQ